MPAADQANASQADPPGLTVSVSVSALQHLIIEVLRRPVEFTLYIHPEECIDCGACVPACPVEAIFVNDEVPDQWENFKEINAKWFGEEVPD